MNAGAGASASAAGGYVTDVAYPDRFHREQMPAWLHATATALGFAPPGIDRRFRWLELGCGGGLTALVAAACNPRGAFTAVDVNPVAVGRATATARDADLRNIDFIAADLRDFAADDGGSPFDFIVLHGLWSWVAGEVRAAVVDLVMRRLAPGGLLQVGYMSHPGASQMQAVHKLMHEAARHAEGDSGRRAVAALGLLERLAEGGAGHFTEHPGARRQLHAMRHEDPAQLAHEFLGPDWEPQHSADVIRRFAAAGCTFIGSATPLENIDALSLPAGVQPLLRSMPPGPLAETVRDFARNQALRRDLFQRDARPLSAAAHLDALDALAYVALPGAPASAAGDLRFDTRIGPVEGPRDWFDPALRALASGPRRFAELRRLQPYAQAPALLNQVLQALTWAGFAHPLGAGPAATIPAAALPRFASLRLLPDAGTAVPRRGPQ